jgi:hypothetical protein
MYRTMALAALLLTGCNALLGNDNVQGPNADAALDACSGIGCMVTNCASQGKPPTSVSGTVRTPLYNALVYVPTARLDPLVDGPAAAACASGAPMVHAFTDVAGRFKLDNVPTVPNLPLVIQVGKWRRETAIAAVNDCADLALPANDTRLPRNSGEGHLPRIAVTTGSVESLECVGRSVGISDSEYSLGTGTGRIHLYAGDGATTTMLGTSALEPVTTLYERMAQYDMLLLSCDGHLVTRPTTAVQALLAYVNARGWAWLSHFHANWLMPPSPFPQFATLNPSNTTAPPSPVTARIDTSSPKGQAFADWMVQVGGSLQPGTMSIEDSHTSCTGIDMAMGAQRQIFLDPAISGGFSGIQLLTWQSSGGGRLLYSDIHLQVPLTPGTAFPAECDSGPLTAQGKSIAFQLFDQPTCLP